jgi:hypothetical protein
VILLIIILVFTVIEMRVANKASEWE